jgi:hypothetical protein
MIYLLYRGRLGNSIFQYALARILSEKFNQRVRDDAPSFFPFTKQNIFNEKIYKKNILVDDSNFLEILELKDLDSTNLIVSGYFANKLFLAKYHKKILDLIDIKSQQREGIFLHYRLGDLLREHKYRIVKHEYYIYCLNEILKTSNQKIFISSDSPRHALIRELQEKYNAQIILNNPTDTIIYGSSFQYKILSFGTFSLWVALLGNQDNVYCPNIKDYPNYKTDIFIFENWKTINKEKYLLKKK